MSNVMGLYVKFTKTTHQIWSCHVTLVSNSKNFYFLPDSVLNFRKSYQIWGKLAQEQKVTSKKQIADGKHPPVLIGLKDKNFLGHFWLGIFTQEPQTGSLAYFSVAVRNRMRKHQFSK